MTWALLGLIGLVATVPRKVGRAAAPAPVLGGGQRQETGEDEPDHGVEEVRDLEHAADEEQQEDRARR